MKNLLSILFFLPALLFGQNNINVNGSAAFDRLSILEATSLSSNYDILEIRAPATGNGQFLECQIGENGEVRAQINYDGSAFFNNQIQVGSQLLLDDKGLNTSAEIKMYDNDGYTTIIARARDASSANGGDILLYAYTGTGLVNTIEMDGNWSGTGKGRIITDELQIKGGSDIAENFSFSNHIDNRNIQPGMLVSIDPNEPGKLKITTQAYDKCVVGAVSGANGVNTGLFLSQKGSVVDGEYPIALAGRVYVYADATYGAIQPGDFLTSSPTPGHVMKVKKHKKAQGGIVGKAMSALENGQGYVLMLINLQ